MKATKANPIPYLPYRQKPEQIIVPEVPMEYGGNSPCSSPKENPSPPQAPQTAQITLEGKAFTKTARVITGVTVKTMLSHITKGSTGLCQCRGSCQKWCCWRS